MSDSDQQPIPQPKWSGGPPKPPKKTARGLQDGSREPPHEDSHTLEMVIVVTNAETTLNQLKILNGGGRPSKRESLEMSLDRNILLLSRLPSSLEKEDRAIVAGILQRIRDYRRLFPRYSPKNQEQADQAKRELDDLQEAQGQSRA